MTLPRRPDRAWSARTDSPPSQPPSRAARGSGPILVRKRPASPRLIIVWIDQPTQGAYLEPMVRGLELDYLVVDKMSLDFVALAERSASIVIAATDGDCASPLLYLRSAGLTLPILVLGEQNADRQLGDPARWIGPERCAPMPRTTQALATHLRALARSSPQPEQERGTGFWLDPVGLLVGYRDRTVKLRLREVALLHCLVRHAGTPMTPARLRTYVWGASPPLARETRTVAVHVCHLRRKLADIGLGGAIRTKRTGEYVFDLPAHRSV